ncbi:MAG: hypothetical protein AB7E14_10515, partial [Citrobacter sp.]|uniref:hypothetical protein n=1 Tax=Citrobacter sp. TaxID=1896336 RepID=UPI003D13FCFA
GRADALPFRQLSYQLTNTYLKVLRALKTYFIHCLFIYQPNVFSVKTGKDFILKGENRHDIDGDTSQHTGVWKQTD